MLILTRQIHEELVIVFRDEVVNIKLFDVSFRRGGVSLGFTASRAVKIYRKEIWDKIQAAETEALGNH